MRPRKLAEPSTMCYGLTPLASGSHPSGRRLSGARPVGQRPRAGQLHRHRRAGQLQRQSVAERHADTALAELARRADMYMLVVIGIAVAAGIGWVVWDRRPVRQGGGWSDLR